MAISCIWAGLWVSSTFYVHPVDAPNCVGDNLMGVALTV